MKTMLTHGTRAGLALAAALFMAAAITAAGAPTPLTVGSARITIAGTSNIHAFTASTTTVRVTNAVLDQVVPGPNFWDAVLKPGAVSAFEIAIPAATLSSPKEGLDKNIHKALKVQEFADITFRLLRLEPAPGGALKAVGVLKIAGVGREITIDVKTAQQEAGLTVKGEVQLLMTDYGIKPPTAMLGMLKTDPKVTVTFETVVAVPLT